MSGLRRLFRNARLIDPESGRDGPGDIIVVDDRIAAIGANISAQGLGSDVEVVDVGGLCLAPGLVDMRVQLREPGAEHIESIESGSRAAAAGGVTTMVALPNTEPVVDDVSVVEFLARRAHEVRLAKVHTYAAATKGLAGKDLTEMGLLAANGALGFTDGVKAVADALVMRRLLAYARSFDQLVIQHPEESSLGGAGEVNEGEVATRLGLAGIPPAAEVIMVERDLRLVALTGARYHVAHVSTAAAIEAIRRAKAAGLPVTCDTAPPYFALNETAVGDYRTFAKLSPPLRSEGSPGRRRRSGGRHDRRHRQRSRAVGPGFQAAAVHLRELRHRRAGDAAAAVARALPQPAFEPRRGDAPVDDRPGAHPRAGGGAPGGRRARGFRDLRPRCRLAHPHRRVPLEIEERAVRWKAGAGPGRADGGRRPHDLRTHAMIGIIAATLIGYLLGSIPFGLILTWLSGRGDVRQIGSGNIGATNVLRTGSKTLAAGTLVLDLGKGTVAAFIGSEWGVEPMLAASAAVLIGHMFPVWLGFRGGKGGATGLGILIAIAWQVALVAAAVWLAVVIASRYSSAAALAAALAAAAYADLTLDRQRAMLITGLVVLVIIRHHENIRRMVAGTESRISFTKS